jgi:hypothetical protein
LQASEGEQTTQVAKFGGRSLCRRCRRRTTGM